MDLFNATTVYITYITLFNNPFAIRSPIILVNTLKQLVANSNIFITQLLHNLYTEEKQHKYILSKFLLLWPL